MSVISAFGTAAPCGSLTVPVMLPAVLDWACTPTSKPTLSRSNSACNPNLLDIPHLLRTSVNECELSEPVPLELLRLLILSALLCCRGWQKYLILLRLLVKVFLERSYFVRSDNNEC